MILSHPGVPGHGAGTFHLCNPCGGQSLVIENFDQLRAWLAEPARGFMTTGLAALHDILAGTDHGPSGLARWQRVWVEANRCMTS